jgi:hypothetical protein
MLFSCHRRASRDSVSGELKKAKGLTEAKPSTSAGPSELSRLFKYTFFLFGLVMDV